MSGSPQLRARLASLHRLVAGVVTDHRSHQRLLVEEALSALGMAYGSIGVIHGAEAVPRLWVDAPGETPLIRPIALEKTLTGEMIRRGGATMMRANLPADPELRDHVQVAVHGVGSFAATSMEIAGETYYFTVAASHVRNEEFTSDDRAYIELLAALFARSLREEEQDQRITDLTNRDRLTSLPVEALMVERIEQLIAAREDEPFAVLAIDLNIHRILEQYEYEAASQTLAAAANRLRALESETTGIYRSGSLDLVIVSEDARTPEQLEALIQRVQTLFVTPFGAPGNPIVITPALGIAVYPQDGSSASELLIEVSAAIRAAGNVVALTDHPSSRRRKLIDLLQYALERGEFVLHYQPYIDAVTDRVRGAEALIRWNNPELGMLPPAVFIPLAEEAGVIVAIGSWVMQESARFSKTLAERGDDLAVSFNVAAPQFRDRAFLDRLDFALSETGSDPRRLILEVTESVAILDAETAKRILTECRTRRLKIALDDFGTGYSSLSHLRELPADSVKIDKSFVATLSEQSESALICSAIIELAHRLGITVHAEGVESEAQLQWLKNEGCDFAQGFLISKPMAEEQLLTWLDSVRTTGVPRAAAAQ